MVSDLSRLPLPIRDQHEAQSERGQRTITAVGRMISLKSRAFAAKTAHERSALQRQIEATDQEIDQLVYELYGLSKQEICIVEEGVKTVAT